MRSWRAASTSTRRKDRGTWASEGARSANWPEENREVLLKCTNPSLRAVQRERENRETESQLDWRNGCATERTRFRTRNSRTRASGLGRHLDRREIAAQNHYRRNGWETLHGGSGGGVEDVRRGTAK